MINAKIAVIVSAMALLSGCGELYTVPPAHKGVIITENGVSDETYGQSTFRMNRGCLKIFGCVPDKLMLVETSMFTGKETVQLNFPLSNNVGSDIDIRYTMYIDGDKIGNILSEVSVAGVVVPSTLTYDTYAKNTVRNNTRQVLAGYSIDYANSNRGEVSEILRETIQNALIDTPVSVKEISIAKLPLPQSIIERNEAAMQRQIEIDEEQARKALAITKLEIELEVSEKERLVELRKAQIDAEIAEITDDIVTPEWLAYQNVDVARKLADNPTVKWIVDPTLNVIPQIQGN